MRTAILTAISMLLPATVIADNFSCPALNGATGKPLAVATVSVFRGPPSQQEDLVPDNTDAGPRDAYFWTFDADEGPAPIWVVCHYKGSKKTQPFALPRPFKKCTVLGPLNVGNGLACE